MLWTNTRVITDDFCLISIANCKPLLILFTQQKVNESVLLFMLINQNTKKVLYRFYGLRRRRRTFKSTNNTDSFILVVWIRLIKFSDSSENQTEVINLSVIMAAIRKWAKHSRVPPTTDCRVRQRQQERYRRSENIVKVKALYRYIVYMFLVLALICEKRFIVHLSELEILQVNSVKLVTLAYLAR